MVDSAIDRVPQKPEMSNLPRNERIDGYKVAVTTDTSHMHPSSPKSLCRSDTVLTSNISLKNTKAAKDTFWTKDAKHSTNTALSPTTRMSPSITVQNRNNRKVLTTCVAVRKPTIQIDVPSSERPSKSRASRALTVDDADLRRLFTPPLLFSTTSDAGKKDDSTQTTESIFDDKLNYNLKRRKTKPISKNQELLSHQYPHQLSNHFDVQLDIPNSEFDNTSITSLEDNGDTSLPLVESFNPIKITVSSPDIHSPSLSDRDLPFPQDIEDIEFGKNTGDFALDFDINDFQRISPLQLYTNTTKTSVGAKSSKNKAVKTSNSLTKLDKLGLMIDDDISLSTSRSNMVMLPVMKTQKTNKKGKYNSPESIASTISTSATSTSSNEKADSTDNVDSTFRFHPERSSKLLRNKAMSPNLTKQNATWEDTHPAKRDDSRSEEKNNHFFRTASTQQVGKKEAKHKRDEIEFSFTDTSDFEVMDDLINMFRESKKGIERNLSPIKVKTKVAKAEKSSENSEFRKGTQNGRRGSLVTSSDDDDIQSCWTKDSRRARESQAVVANLDTSKNSRKSRLFRLGNSTSSSEDSEVQVYKAINGIKPHEDTFKSCSQQCTISKQTDFESGDHSKCSRNARRNSLPNGKTEFQNYILQNDAHEQSTEVKISHNKDVNVEKCRRRSRSSRRVSVPMLSNKNEITLDDPVLSNVDKISSQQVRTGTLGSCGHVKSTRNLSNNDYVDVTGKEKEERKIIESGIVASFMHRTTSDNDEQDPSERTKSKRKARRHSLSKSGGENESLACSTKNRRNSNGSEALHLIKSSIEKDLDPSERTKSSQKSRRGSLTHSSEDDEIKVCTYTDDRKAKDTNLSSSPNQDRTPLNMDSDQRTRRRSVRTTRRGSLLLSSDEDDMRTREERDNKITSEDNTPSNPNKKKNPTDINSDQFERRKSTRHLRRGSLTLSSDEDDVQLNRAIDERKAREFVVVPTLQEKEGLDEKRFIRSDCRKSTRSLRCSGTLSSSSDKDETNNPSPNEERKSIKSETVLSPRSKSSRRLHHVGEAGSSIRTLSKAAIETGVAAVSSSPRIVLTHRHRSPRRSSLDTVNVETRAKTNIPGQSKDITLSAKVAELNLSPRHRSSRRLMVIQTACSTRTLVEAKDKTIRPSSPSRKSKSTRRLSSEKTESCTQSLSSNDKSSSSQSRQKSSKHLKSDLIVESSLNDSLLGPSLCDFKAPNANISPRKHRSSRNLVSTSHEKCSNTSAKKKEKLSIPSSTELSKINESSVPTQTSRVPSIGEGQTHQKQSRSRSCRRLSNDYKTKDETLGMNDLHVDMKSKSILTKSSHTSIDNRSRKAPRRSTLDDNLVTMSTLDFDDNLDNSTSTFNCVSREPSYNILSINHKTDQVQAVKTMFFDDTWDFSSDNMDLFFQEKPKLCISPFKTGKEQ